MPIKILQFTSLGNRYDMVDNIVQFADKEKFEVGICVRTDRIHIELPVYQKDTFYRVLNKDLSRKAIPQTVWHLAQVLREWKPDILHTHHYEEAFIGFLAKKLCSRIKLIVGRHYSDFFYCLPQGVKTRALLKIEGLSNNAAEKIIVPTRSVAELLIERQDISSNKVKVIPYGFVDEKFDQPSDADIKKLRSELNFEGRFVVGNFSKLITEKGLSYLIMAAARLRSKIPHLLIVIAGEGRDQKIFERQVSKLGLEGTIKFLGFRQDAMTLMSAVNVVAQTSLQEAFGQVVVEAMWMKKPIVTTDVGVAADIIETEVNGILIPKSDENSIAKALEKLANDEFLCQKLADNGQKFVKNNLAIKKIIKTYEDTYKQVVGV